MANNSVQYQNSGCGILSALGLMACLVYATPHLLMEYKDGRMATDYVATTATIYNVKESDERYFPGLRYTFAEEEFVTKTFFSEEEWPLGLDTWHWVKNKITAAGKRGGQLEIYVDPEQPKLFALVNKPSRAVYFYTAILLGGIMVFGGLIWTVNSEMNRKRWVQVKEWE